MAHQKAQALALAGLYTRGVVVPGPAEYRHPVTGRVARLPGSVVCLGPWGWRSVFYFTTTCLRKTRRPLRGHQM